jgi:hypothetical protein
MEALEGYEVVTCDDCKVGHVVGTRGDYLLVEHGTLFKSKHAIPRSFVEPHEDEQVVRTTVSKEVFCESPKVNGDFDEREIALHYGLASAEDEPLTRGYGDVLPDDPARSAEQDALRAGIRTDEQERLAVRDGGDPAEAQQTTSPGLLGGRTPDTGSRGGTSA